nr:hypothetical protein [Aquisphaera insulae]
MERFFECATAAGVLLPEGPIIAKHQVQVFLATRRKAQMMPGIAAYDGVWPFDDPLFDAVSDFLKKL